MPREQPRQVPHPPSVPLDKEQFRRKLRDYAEAQQITNLNDDVISDLFRITSDAADNYSVKKDLSYRAIKADVTRQNRLLKTLDSQLKASLKVLTKYEKRLMPETVRWVQRLRKKFLQLRRSLGPRVPYQFRAREAIQPILDELDFPGDLSLEIDEYLRDHVPEIGKQESHNIVIAGCLIAGDFYSNPDDLVSVIPMQLSRARRRAAAKMKQPDARKVKSHVRKKKGHG
jgi:hypothetical protein